MDCLKSFGPMIFMARLDRYSGNYKRCSIVEGDTSIVYSLVLYFFGNLYRYYVAHC